MALEWLDSRTVVGEVFRLGGGRSGWFFHLGGGWRWFREREKGERERGKCEMVRKRGKRN